VVCVCVCFVCVFCVRDTQALDQLHHQQHLTWRRAATQVKAYRLTGEGDVATATAAGTGGAPPFVDAGGGG
jgi:hypothetical protein